jgi:hypothetical protein
MGRRPFEFVLSEADNMLSRDQVTVEQASARVLVPGQVLGRVFTAVVAKVSGTGDGNAAAASVTFGRDAKPGVYTLTCTAAASNAGTFSVVAPDGTRLADLTVASAYTSTHINLTIPDGGTDWGVGAIITVTLTAKVKPYTAGETDGSQTAIGILGDHVDASVADQKAVMMARECEVFANRLTGSTATALAQLANLNIIAR